MKKLLRAAPLVVVACVCIVLLCIGTMAAIGLVLVGVLALFSGLAENAWDLAGLSLFGLVTVSLTSVCCFHALMYLADRCISALEPGGTMLDGRTIATAMAVVFVTLCQWCAVRSADWLVPVCIAADVLHLALLLKHIRQRRKRT